MPLTKGLPPPLPPPPPSLPLPLLLLLLLLLQPLTLAAAAEALPKLLTQATVLEGSTNFRLDVRQLLVGSGVAASDIGRVSFFKAEASRPFQLQNGLMSLATPPDRELLCPTASGTDAACSVRLRIEAVVGGVDKEYFVQVFVEDVNDCSPTFGTGSECRFLRVAESDAAHDVELRLPKASDADSRQFGVSFYTIADKRPSAEAFDASFELVADTQGPRLRALRPLDREKVARYEFRLVAVDAGRPPRNGSVRVEVDIDDINDSAPRISEFRPDTLLRVNESAGRQTVATFRVADADFGENARVECKLAALAPTTEEQLQRSFRVQMQRRDGGGAAVWQVLTVSSLDFESVPQYSFLVVAADSGRPSLSASVSVSVAVVNIDDNPISITFWHESRQQQRVSVPENLEAGHKVATLEVKDKDFTTKSELSQITCNLLSENWHFHLEVKPLFDNAREFSLLTARPLDRETNASHRVIVECHDQRQPASVKATAELLVDVEDRNDFRPKFAEAEFRGRVAENSRVGTAVTMTSPIVAIDHDAYANARIKFDLVGSDSTSFRIDTSGRLTVAADVDFERKRRYAFNVTAVNVGSDSAPPTIAGVVIDIDDLNDNAPVIAEAAGGYRFEVAEGKAGELVGWINASDADFRPENRRVMFRILDDSEAKRSFSIEPVTGRLVTKVALDRESRNQFRFRVEAFNQRRSLLLGDASVTMVTVDVTDVNDHAPRLCHVASTATCRQPHAGRISVTFDPMFTDERLEDNDSRCAVFDFEPRDADSGAAEQPDCDISVGNVSELLLDGGWSAAAEVRFSLEGQLLCVRSLPASTNSRQQFRLVLRLSDRQPPNPSVEYTCLATVVRRRRPVQSVGAGPARPEGDSFSRRTVGSRRNFIIIVAMVTAIVLAAVAAFAVVAFYYVRRMGDVACDKEISSTGATLTLRYPTVKAEAAAAAARSCPETIALLHRSCSSNQQQQPPPAAAAAASTIGGFKSSERRNCYELWQGKLTLQQQQQQQHTIRYTAPATGPLQRKQQQQQQHNSCDDLTHLGAGYVTAAADVKSSAAYQQLQTPLKSMKSAYFETTFV